MLSVLASSLANLKFLSLEYLLHSFILSMNIPLLTTPSLRSSHIVVVWECKNRFFCIHYNTVAHFFLIFLYFLCMLLIVNKIKMHFSLFLAVFLLLKRHFYDFFSLSHRKISQIFGKLPQKSNSKDI